MIVYVETNFLLELAYLQESYESCEEILRLAKAGSIAVVLPTCCISEAYLTWHRKNMERTQFHAQLQTHIAELSRSAPLRGLADQYREAMTALIAGSEESRDRLFSAINSVEVDGATIPVTARIVLLAGLQESACSLSPQDALVLASVTWDSVERSEPQCFVTKDRGFAKRIREELRSGGGECKVISNFDDAVAYIKSALGKS